MRAPFLSALVTAFLLAPLAAEAGNSKGPWFMLVNADGTKAHGSPEIFTGRVFGQPVGVYLVQVIPKEQRFVDDCVAVASPAQGAIGTIGIDTSQNGTEFFVWTTVGGGAALADLPFYVVVHCPKLGKGG
jgi:hypothetical protein